MHPYAGSNRTCDDVTLLTPNSNLKMFLLLNPQKAADKVFADIEKVCALNFCYFLLLNYFVLMYFDNTNSVSVIAFPFYFRHIWNIDVAFFNFE